MDTMRNTALVAGVFYLITFISSIPAVFLLDPVLNNSDYIVSSGSDTRVLCGLKPEHVHHRYALPVRPSSWRSRVRI